MKGIPEVWIDGTLYVSIAVLTILISETRNITPEVLKGWTWVNYMTFFSTVLLAGSVSLKTFRSESVGRHRQDVRMQQAKEGGDTETEISTRKVETETVTTDNKNSEMEITTEKIDKETVTTDNKDSETKIEKDK